MSQKYMDHLLQDEEREKLQMQLQQQLQTSEELVQELKSRVDEKEAAVRSLESEKETAVRNLESEKKSISNAAAETKVFCQTFSPVKCCHILLKFSSTLEYVCECHTAGFTDTFLPVQ